MDAVFFRFDFHWIVSLHTSDYDSDYDSFASQNQPSKAKSHFKIVLQ